MNTSLDQATKTADIRDIHGLVEISSPWALLPWILLALAALVAIGWLVYRLRRPPPAPPAPPPEVVALAALERTRALMTPAQAELFGTAVSAAVRAYIEARFDVRAPRQTTKEFFDGLSLKPVPGLDRHGSALQDLLSHMDLVKFAREPLDAEEMETLLQAAQRFVRETSLRETQEPT